MIGLVVDTSVLYKANNSGASENWDAVSLLTRLPGNASVYLDQEDRILQEYRRLFQAGIQSFAFHWWQKQLSVDSGVCYVAGRLTEQEAATFSRLRCDQDDVAFIAVGLRANVPIVHEDSDYEQNCAQTLGVVGHRLTDACTSLGL